jgi:hypothetical protein
LHSRAIVLLFRSAEGGEFPIELQQIAELISKLEGLPTPTKPKDGKLGVQSNGRIVG